MLQVFGEMIKISETLYLPTSSNISFILFLYFLLAKLPYSDFHPFASTIKDSRR